MHTHPFRIETLKSSRTVVSIAMSDKLTKASELCQELGGFSWRGGTREYPHRQDEEQSEEPPAEYWERRERRI